MGRVNINCETGPASDAVTGAAGQHACFRVRRFPDRMLVDHDVQKWWLLWQTHATLRLTIECTLEPKWAALVVPTAG